MSKRESARRVQEAIVDLQRITNSRTLHAVRSARSGVTLTPAASSVLRHIDEKGPIRPADLADRIRTKPPALSRQLKSLEQDGSIERIPSPGDGRGSLVRVTRRGRALVRRLEQADEEILAEQLRGWSATDLQQLSDLFDRLIHDLRAPAPAPTTRKPR